MPRDATVSVIIPCRDAAPFLAETIESVLAQRHAPVEPIVVDDGSRDGSWSIARSYGERVRAVRQEGRGACGARNRGARLATGAYVMFLDADDVIAPDALGALVDALGAHRDRVALCAWSWLVRAGVRWTVAPGLPPAPPGGDAIGGWLAGWYAPPCAVLWPRAAFERTGGWDETVVADQDGDLMLRALIGGLGITVAAGGHAYYRDHGTARASVSKDISPEALRSRRRVIERAARLLREDGRDGRYAVPIGQAYHRLARMAYDVDPSFARDCARRAAALAGGGAAVGRPAHRLFCRLVGLERERRIARVVRGTGVLRATRRLRGALRPSYTGARERGPDAAP